MEEKKNLFRELITLSDLFYNKFFSIPDYQRGYSWDEDQLNDLINDMQKLLGAKHLHYTGTIVLTLKKDKENVYSVVDGQQRLTSLIIALTAIYQSNTVKYARLKSKYLISGSVGNEQLVLSSDDKSTNEFINDVIFGNTNVSPKNKSQTLLFKAKEFFKKWVNNNVNILDEFVDLIENKLGFLVYNPENSKEIGIMFEVINNRGKSLSELEKIKNYFIYYSTIYEKNSLREIINQKWSTILRHLSIANITDNDDENSFLRNCYVVFYYASKSKSWYVYNEIKERFQTDINSEAEIDSNISSIEAFVGFLERASKYYAYLLNGGYFDLDFIGDLGDKQSYSHALRLLRCQHVNASILPLYLSVMDTYQNDINKLLKLLAIIEILNFRVYILPKVTNRADTYQSALFWTSYLFFNQNRNEEVKLKWDKYSEFTVQDKLFIDPFDKLSEILKEFTKRFCNEKLFVQSLTLDNDESDNYFQWNGLRYLLANYEYAEKKTNSKIDWDIEKILITRKEAGKNTNNYLSIEHIWATNNRLKEVAENHMQKRRLGNFVLLGLRENIQSSDMDIKDKITFMIEENKKNDSDFNLAQVAQINSKYFPEAEKYVTDVLKYKKRTFNYFIDLSTHLNDLRETDLIKYALKRWAFEDEKFDNFVKVDSFLARKERSNESYILNNIKD